jgi:hypothetical protein
MPYGRVESGLESINATVAAEIDAILRADARMRLVRLVDIEPAFGMEAPVHPDAPDSVTPVLVDRGVFPMVLPVSLAGLIVLDLRRAEFEDPGPQLRPGELLDRAILAESANRAVEDHPVPLEGLGHGAFGGFRSEEQIDGPAEFQVPARISSIDSGSPNQVPKDQGSQVPKPCSSPPATNRGSVFKGVRRAAGRERARQIFEEQEAEERRQAWEQERMLLREWLTERRRSYERR